MVAAPNWSLPSHQTSAAHSATSSHAARDARGRRVGAAARIGHRDTAGPARTAPRAEAREAERYPAAVSRLRFGLVFDLLGTHPPRPARPRTSTRSTSPRRPSSCSRRRCAGSDTQPVRLGNPHALLATLGKGELPPLDVALSIAEGYGSRNREAWAPVLLEMAGVPCLGSDAPHALALARQGVGAPARGGGGRAGAATRASVGRGRACATRATRRFPLFVKPRWEGTAKGIGPHSRVDDAAALARAVARIERDYDQPALVERFLPGAEYTVTVVGHAPPRALPVLQRALEPTTRDRPARGRAPSRAAGRLARAHARRARRARSSASSRGSRCARSTRSSAATSRARTSGSTPPAARSSSRSTRCRPSRPTARSRSSPSSPAARRRDLPRRGARRGAAAARARDERARARRRSARAPADWRDWTWQMRNRIRTRRASSRASSSPTPDERAGDRAARRALPLRDHALLRVADGPARSRVPDPPPGGAAASPSSTIRPASPIRSTRSPTRRSRT